ncbi:hypothetical protein GCM10011494_10460 [Novosphingobium endophyticum]|uniref:Phasin domain-containing protein n=1 Tax=Novosphingobium endophyticum TaxID=1955250 RepID=A0A916X4P0_9SPHN|nr:phasin family protein [Novosphingobium endophyticum]GGB93931.1 hypothetical protein GCM10011494_10460 [Novosphingobium endophyticum]
MADNENNTGTARAEKAYEAAVSATPVNAKAPVAATSPKPATPAAKEAKAEPVSPSQPQPVKAESAPVSQAQPVKAEAAPEVKTTTSVEPAPSAKPAKAAPKVKAPVRRKPTVKAKPAPKSKATPAVRAKRKPAASAVSAKTAPTKTAPTKTAAARTAPAKPAVPALKAAKKTAGNKQSIFAGLFRNFFPEEKTMNMNANFAGIQDAMTEAQAKAKAAFEKSSSVLGEVSDFTKGNLEAVMESGKILAEGIQGIGSEIVAEGRSNFEAMSGDIKELAAAKSPSDFIKVQGDMMRKNIDSAVASSAKNSEAMLKLVSDAMAPISGRVSLAMEKVRQTSN